MAWVDNPDLRPLGPYVLEQELGRGAMSRVYRATDTRNARVVAIKVLHLSTDFRGETVLAARQAFLRESRLARQLRHPDIVAVLDAGHENERSYLVMEFVRGVDPVSYTHLRAHETG
jgi:serine/threonine protein kinase